MELPEVENDAPVAMQDVEIPPLTRVKVRPLLAFIVTMAVVISVLALLPTTVASMVDELRGQAISPIYDMFTGQEIDPEQIAGPDAAFVHVSITQLDEARMVAALTISGHRVCQAFCPNIQATFYSLGNDAARRRGLPPSATVEVPGQTGSYTFQIELPVRGTPQRYPFDDYHLTLGLIVSAQAPNGEMQEVTSKALVRQTTVLTLEDLVTRLNMTPPQPVDPASVRSPSDPSQFILVDQLQWERPRYLRILTALLVVLISASGIFALGLRTLHELVLGIGGIILGIWGVRSVVVQSPLPDVTLIDLILGFVMLSLMLALAARAARYFYLQSGLTRGGKGGRGKGGE